MVPSRLRGSLLGWACLVTLAAGCGDGKPGGTTDPEAKLRLERLLEGYIRYASQHRHQGPPSEQAFGDFLQKLPQADRDRLHYDSANEFFLSPRDGQKFVVRWNFKLDPGGEQQAVAWEAAGQNGRRFVALSIGYVEEYGEEGFKKLVK